MNLYLGKTIELIILKLNLNRVRKLQSILIYIFATLFVKGINAQNLFPTPSGNVGIGTTTPSHHLDISTSGNYQGIQLYHGSGRWSRFYSSMPSGSYNGITGQNDSGIIFGLEGGTLTHGFVIVPHRNLTSGLRIDNAGNVGVGATSSDGFQVGITLSQETSRGVDNVRMGVMGTPRIILDKAGQVPFEIDNAGGRLRIFNPGFEMFTINSVGNIGIGASAPNFKLDISTSGDYQGIQLSHGSGRWSRFYSSMPVGSFNGITGKNDAGIIFGNDGGSLENGFVIAPHINSNSGLRIDKLGNVGIGTTSPDAKLAVNGIIHAEEVTVDLNVPGPDYVFEPTYNLPSPK
jgi:hypothetical protein